MEPCSTCAFGLWNPIMETDTYQVGLYDDSRFPGRLILSLKTHHEHLDEVPFVEATNFMAGIQRLSRAAKTVAGVERVNVAILGNQEAHVHAHIIPRRPTDGAPTKAPWEDPRPRQKLSRVAVANYIEAYRTILEEA